MGNFKHSYTEEEKQAIYDAAIKDANERLELAKIMVQPIITMGEVTRQVTECFRKSIKIIEDTEDN